MRPQRLLLFALMSCGLSGLDGRGAEATLVNDAPRPRITVPATAATPLMTAAADDPAWSHAATISILTPSLSSTPPPTRSIPGTEVRLLWDSQWLYIRFLCHDDQPYLPVHGLNAPIYQGDAVEVFLDPVGDCREWMELEFNAANDLFFQNTVCVGEPAWDDSLRLTSMVIARDLWTFPDATLSRLRHAAADWKINGRTVGWIVDIAVPAAPLLKRSGGPKIQTMTLRGNFLRYKWIPGSGAKRNLLSLNWSPTILYIPHRCPAAFGWIDLSNNPP
jgi:hypothetical protein